MATVSKTMGNYDYKVEFSKDSIGEESIIDTVKNYKGVVTTYLQAFSFNINGQAFEVVRKRKAIKPNGCGTRISDSYEYDGIVFGDNQKKVIEYILSK